MPELYEPGDIEHGNTISNIKKRGDKGYEG